jgi:hypothetical protein
MRMREIAFVLSGRLASALPNDALYRPGDAIDIRTVITGTPLPATVITATSSLHGTGHGR